MSETNDRRQRARFWVGVGLALIAIQVIVFLYIPVHFFYSRSDRIADFLIVFLVPLGGFAARLLHAAVPKSGWDVNRNRWRTLGLLSLLVVVTLVSGLSALFIRSDHALRLILANFAIALPLTSISISESLKNVRNGRNGARPLA